MAPDPSSEFPEKIVPGMVSVVITAYNRARFLRGSIDSALAQSYRPLEVIVVDDGSTDETPQICREYGDRIRYFWKPNGGAASAKNFGIRRMRGGWLTILDSDDKLDPVAVSAFVNWAAKLRSEQLSCESVVIEEDGAPKAEQPTRIRRELKGDAYLRWLWSGRNDRHDPPFVSALMGGGLASRSLVFRVGLPDDSERSGGEDWEWELKAAFIHRYTAAFLPFRLLRYREHPGQLMSSLAMVDLARGPAIRARLRRYLSDPSVTPGPLMEHYRQETRRLRRVYSPFVPMLKLMRLMPLRRKVEFWTWEIAPGLMAKIYWASDPPVDA
ncbi:MAG TPA: glycosyltransferase family 2 protein [Conexivisphaerales archaeon]|nr:glycosyltransferase family 2 protein [Conexivisphaerales archaeon]